MTDRKQIWNFACGIYGFWVTRWCVIFFAGPVIDPNAPKPEGSTIAPTIGEQLIVSEDSSAFCMFLLLCSTAVAFLVKCCLFLMLILCIVFLYYVYGFTVIIIIITIIIKHMSICWSKQALHPVVIHFIWLAVVFRYFWPSILEWCASIYEVHWLITQRFQTFAVKSVLFQRVTVWCHCAHLCDSFSCLIERLKSLYCPDP